MIPIRYVEPVYRPPSEAQSLILPVTDGCSWNQCTFCTMYTAPQKAFRARSEDEVLDSIRRTGALYGSQLRRVFLADGDALVLPTRRLLAILDAIRQHLAKLKCPRTVDFTDALPRLPTGKLYKKPLRDKYWAGHQSRIV